MAKFKTEMASVSWSNKEYKAVKGVITIPDDEIKPFLDLIKSGDLVTVKEDAATPPTTPTHPTPTLPTHPAPPDGGQDILPTHPTSRGTHASNR